MRLSSRYKDWRRRRLLRRAGIRVRAVRPLFAAGARSGVWVVDPTALGADSVVWSVGVGDNVAWDLAMIERFGCAIDAFDPTPRACAWLGQQRLPAGFRHHALGVAAFDGEQTFAAPAKDKDVNFRPLPDLPRTDRRADGDAADGGAPGCAGDADGVLGLRAPVRRLATLQRELGHERVDVLKLDIEGGEYDVLDDLLAHGPRPAQLLVEFHHGERGIPFAATARAIAELAAAGYLPFWISERGLEFSFART